MSTETLKTLGAVIIALIWVSLMVYVMVHKGNDDDDFFSGD